MTEHYFSRNPQAGHRREKIDIVLRGRTYVFYSDAGVFSKQNIDFGSRLLIETMHIPADAKVLDVGCGYGPIGLAAAGLACRGTVTMIDVNERAVELARENAKNNGIRNVEIFQSDLFAQVGEARFDRILTNPPIRAGKRVVHRIFEESAVHLLPKGELWVVIQKKQGAASALSKLASIYPIVEEEAKDKGYRIFKAINA